jgi:hypothetical protein
MAWEVVEGRFIKDTSLNTGEGIEEALAEYWIESDLPDKDEILVNDLKTLINSKGGNASLLGDVDDLIDDVKVEEALQSTMQSGAWAAYYPGGDGSLGDVVINSNSSLQTGTIHQFNNLTVDGVVLSATGDFDQPLIILVKNSLNIINGGKISYDGEDGDNGAPGTPGDPGDAGDAGANGSNGSGPSSNLEKGGGGGNGAYASGAYGGGGGGGENTGNGGSGEPWNW